MVLKTMNIGYKNRYLEANTMAGICLFSILFVSSAAFGGTDEERKLSFYNTHTHERLMVIYKECENYIPEALKRVNYILRDHRTGEIHPIDPKLMDYLYDVLTRVGNHGEVHIISGYRSPRSNTKLRKRSKGVAGGSLHMQGRALDFRLPGTDIAVLRDTALAMKRGGVGYYKKSDFIQIDTGRVRFW